MIFFCVLFLLKVFFIFKKQGAYVCPGTNFLLHEFHQNIITLIFLQTFLTYMKTHAIYMQT